MSVIFGYSREAVRVKVKKCEGLLQPEFRKFSVDPQITSFEVLQSILGKAFDIKGEFTICYRTYDVNGHETYLPLLSDWDLDAAFLKAHNTSVVTGSEPCLCLRVDMKPFEETSDDWDGPSTVSVITQFRTGTAQEVKPSQRLPGLIMNQVERTFNMVQRAFNLGEDVSTVLQQPPRPPLSDSEFRKFLDPVGQILHTKDLRSVIYLGGIDPSLRKVVWKHILNVYPDGMCGRERMDYIKRKAAEYVSLRDAWKDAVQKGPVTGDLAYTTGMVRKDVLRTDRHHKFYAGSDDNQNIASLFNILTTYALNHPKVSYCQGMSDLASPLLVTMGDEAHAYICFCALMTRLSTNFMLDGIAMTQKFTHLAEGIMYYDPEFYNYLKSHQADDLLFCYRWLLLEMKREFAFEDSLRMLEVLWSSLPAQPPDKELKLFETRFYPQVNATPPVSPLIKTPRENAYTKVCALRRQTSSISLASYMGSKVPQPVKRQNFSLDENVCRLTKNLADTKYKSLDDAMVGLSQNNSSKNLDAKSDTKSKSSITTNTSSDEIQSNDSISRPRSVSPLEPKSDSQVVLNNRINNPHVQLKSNVLSSSMTSLIKTSNKKGHFKDLKDRISAGKIGIFSSLDKLDMTQSIKEESETTDKKPIGKIVRNFNEFLNFASPTKANKSSLQSASSSDDNPIITLTPTDSSNSKSRLSSTKSDSCTDDLFDGSSPDDSQEYFPMTTSMTRELRLELENLDRQVFGNKYNNVNLDDSDSCSNESSFENKTKTCDCVVSKSEMNTDQTLTEVAEIGSTPRIPSSLKLEEKLASKNGNHKKTDDIFVWENPLHQSSPSLNAKTNLQTPDEQADLEFDSDLGLGDLIDESRGIKSVTPIKLVRKTQKSSKKVVTEEPVKKLEEERTIPQINVNGGTIPTLTNSCEEITEIKPSGSSALPPPHEFGGGNPFLMFLCLTVLLQHREIIVRNGMDYNEMAMHFDKMVRKHNVNRVLNQARQMYTGYIKQYHIAQHSGSTTTPSQNQNNGGEFA